MTGRHIAVAALILASGLTVSAQDWKPETLVDVRLPRAKVVTPRTYMDLADSLRREYRFADASDIYTHAMDISLDDRLSAEAQAHILECQRGINMADICSTPVVVARKRFSLKDFYLYYPLKNQSWRANPNPLDSAAFFIPTYLPKGESEVFFSAADSEGYRNIFTSTYADSTWTVPVPLGEALLSPGNDIGPMLSPDGNTLYFASDGLYGVGGYDLYKSVWDADRGAWGAPVNLGFPYSSPSDDFLLVNTDDGNYTIFASNRGCSKDSVYVYVLEYEANPVTKKVEDWKTLGKIAALDPEDNPFRMDNTSAVSGDSAVSDDTRIYQEKLQEQMAVRDTLRARASAGAPTSELDSLVARMNALDEEIRRIEQSFLRSGAVSGKALAEKEVVGAELGYTFTKKTMGQRLRIKVERHVQDPRTRFRITPIGRFSEVSTLPGGLIYQIQFMTTSRHASVEDIGGMSPVVERLTPSLKYTYSAGVFFNYQDALRHLNKVRRQGFADCEIVAYLDGRQISTEAAWERE